MEQQAIVKRYDEIAIFRDTFLSLGLQIDYNSIMMKDYIRSSNVDIDTSIVCEN